MAERSTYVVPKMDCPSEERLIRIALEAVDGVRTIECDLNKRTVIVVHEADPASILDHLLPLGLGSEHVETEHVTSSDESSTPVASEGRVLRQLLVINAIMFVVEVAVGWLAESTGLIADGLDMFADAGVYGLSLYAVGRSKALQRRAARLSGYAQAFLALGAMIEVIRRSLFGSEPVSEAMIGVAAVALVANLLCIALLHRHREGGLHMRASWIFSTNDAIANLGVIVAGALVYVLGSSIPDLVVGAVIAVVVMRGAIRILRLSTDR